MHVETVIYLNDGSTIEIIRDPDPSNPRTEQDNVGKMICMHRRYTLGDEHSMKPDEYNGWAEVEATIRAENEVAVLLPIYMYDHGGIALSTEPFSCPWDSGQVGVIYATTEKVQEGWPSTKDNGITPETVERVKQTLQAEVAIYQQFLSNDVWGFRIKDSQGHETDSCWGFYGEDVEENGMSDHWPDDIREEAIAKARDGSKNVNINTTPQYEHDQQCCVFLGRHGTDDLYYCPDEKPCGTLIARYGNNGPDYKSGLPFALSDPVMFEALLRAVEQRVLTAESRKRIVEMVAERRETPKGGRRR